MTSVLPRQAPAAGRSLALWAAADVAGGGLCCGAMMGAPVMMMMMLLAHGVRAPVRQHGGAWGLHVRGRAHMRHLLGAIERKHMLTVCMFHGDVSACSCSRPTPSTCCG